jgi:hypothetical protein
MGRRPEKHNTGDNVGGNNLAMVVRRVVMQASAYVRRRMGGAVGTAPHHAAQLRLPCTCSSYEGRSDAPRYSTIPSQPSNVAIKRILKNGFRLNITQKL